MTDITDSKEDLPENEPRLPSTNFGKIRMILQVAHTKVLLGYGVFLFAVFEFNFDFGV